MADLTTVVAVKDYAGVSAGGDDSSIGGIVAAVSVLIHGMIGHNYDPDTILGEVHSGPYTTALLLHQIPDSITEVRVAGVVVTGYEFSAGSRLLFRMNAAGTESIAWESGRRNIEVDYVPTSTIPADLELAAREISAFMLKQTSLAVGGSRLGLSAQSNADTGGAEYFAKTIRSLPMASAVLKRYRRVA